MKKIYELTKPISAQMSGKNDVGISDLRLFDYNSDRRNASPSDHGNEAELKRTSSDAARRLWCGAEHF